MRTAFEILDFLTSEDHDQPLEDVKARILDFIKAIEKIHEPLTGEAYPEDRNRYCAVCMSGDGGSRRYPCGTIKAVSKYLSPV